jgi:hypothetical protein
LALNATADIFEMADLRGATLLIYQIGCFFIGFLYNYHYCDFMVLKKGISQRLKSCHGGDLSIKLYNFSI